MGIFLEQYSLVQETVLWPTFCLGFLLVLPQIFPLSPVLNFRLRRCFGIGIILLLITTGYILSLTYQNQHRAIVLPERATIVVHICAPFEKKTKIYQTTAQLLAYLDSTKYACDIPSNRRIIIQIPHKLYDSTLTINDIVVANSQIYRIRNKGNPYEWDYEDYMSQKNIHHRAYLFALKNTHQKYAPAKNQTMVHLREAIHEKIISLYPQNHAFVGAILLGDRSEITPLQQAQFSQSGLAHILAVSGLHTGLIYMLLSLLFIPLHLLHLRKVALLGVIFMLWAYAYLCGLPTSVIRASCMLTLLLLGKMFLRGYNALHALYLTGCILLCYNPNYIQDIGFQLSFLAVLSILTFYRPLIKLFGIDHWKQPAYYVANLMCLSLSAQVFTLPLSVYYFHCIPIWFLLANIVVIPCLPLIIGSTCISLGLLFCHIKLPLLFALQEGSVSYLLDFIAWTTRLPQVAHYYPDTIDLLFSYLLLLIWTATLYHVGIKRFTKALFLTFITVFIYYAGQDESYPCEMVVFNQSPQNSIHFFRNKKHTVIAFDSIDASEILNFSTRPYIERFRSQQNLLIRDSLHQNVELMVNKPFFAIAKRRFCLLLDNRFEGMHCTHPIAVDYLLVGKQFDDNLAHIEQIIHYDSLIVLPSLPAYRAEEICREAAKRHRPVYDIKKAGAWRLPL